MKKNILVGSLITLAMLGVSCLTQSVFAKTMKGDIQAIRIPQGTVLNVDLLDGLSTGVAGVGDEFSAMLKEDKIVANQIALPAGSVIRGTIARIVPPKRLSKSAILYLTFDHVVTPTGRQIPINAGLYNYPELTLDGGVYKNGNYGYAIRQNWENTKAIFNKAVNWGKGTGETLQYVFVPISAAGGVIGGGAYYVGDAICDLIKKGNNVDLNQGKSFQIMLSQPLDIPLH